MLNKTKIFVLTLIASCSALAVTNEPKEEMLAQALSEPIDNQINLSEVERRRRRRRRR